ncbi:MAG: hypothetical protein GY854_20780 [Deltaproteobacteria bacterium]|nr:hypothetical protein [Deltaproteobacteria bacterium]
MKEFISHHAELVTSVLSGFDRLVFRGHLLPLMQAGGMFFFLEAARIRLLDYKKYVTATSQRLKDASLAEAIRGNRPVMYLESSRTSKEDLARRLLAEHPRKKPGLICAFKVVEPCMTFEYHRSKDPMERGLRLRPNKCLHIYKYYQHPTFGFINARIQTWFPFNIQICLNGREWLGRQLQRRRLRFERADNCFTALGSPVIAQRLMDEQLQCDWPGELTAIARALNPIHEKVFASSPMDYYWSVYQSEWATDILFQSPDALAALYPSLVRFGIENLKTPDVMRFLGRKLHGNFKGESTTSYKHRIEGARVKHWVNGNSVKMYDKAGRILRVETTMGNTADFKVFRPRNDDPKGKLEWQPLRKGVADIHRRAEVSHRSNERYLDALSVVEDSTKCSQIFDIASRPVVCNGRRYRALRIGEAEDIAFMEAISRGEFVTAGFRNRDLQRYLYPGIAKATNIERKRISAKISRMLRLLRAHGIIKKINRTYRYQLTKRGRQLTAALQATRSAPLNQALRDAS